MPRDFSSGAWSRKPQRGPEANFVEPIEDRKHDRKRQNSRDYESAIESAFIDFPHVGHGETWPQNYKENAECKTLAIAVLSSLEKWGYKIVPISVPDENPKLGLDGVDPAAAGMN